MTSRPVIKKKDIIDLVHLDRSRPAVRRALLFRDKLLSERGGADQVDAVTRQSIDFFSSLSAMVEDLLARRLNGEDVDITELNSLLNSRRRESELIGGPQPRDVTPTLDAYIRMNKDEAEDEPAQGS